MQECCLGYFPYNSHILGDSAYPQLQHIMVPYKDNDNLTRNERILKERWRRLKYRELHCSERIPHAIMSACVLHNFCIEREVEIQVNFDILNNNDMPGSSSYDQTRSS